MNKEDITSRPGYNLTFLKDFLPIFGPYGIFKKLALNRLKSILFITDCLRVLLPWNVCEKKGMRLYLPIRRKLLHPDYYGNQLYTIPPDEISYYSGVRGALVGLTAN
jgi:hypothetical protein